MRTADLMAEILASQGSDRGHPCYDCGEPVEGALVAMICFYCLRVVCDKCFVPNGHLSRHTDPSFVPCCVREDDDGP